MTMKAKPLVFNWVETGTNCNAPILEVHCFGYKAKVYKAFDNSKWCSNVNGFGKSGISSESDAKHYAENYIKQEIESRIILAVRDINLLTDTTVSIAL